jgi:hypothetical protein
MHRTAEKKRDFSAAMQGCNAGQAGRLPPQKSDCAVAVIRED